MTLWPEEQRVDADESPGGHNAALALVVLAGAGVLGGLVWSWWAEPATYTVTRQGTFLDEEQLGRLFGIEARYALVGVVGGFLVSALLAVWLHRAGWRLVVGVVSGAAVAAAVSYFLGVALGPGVDVDAARSAAPGDVVAMELSVHTAGLFLAWPVGALAGLLVGVWAIDRPAHQEPDPALLDLSRS